MNTVLLVEDEQQMANTLIEGLTKHGFEVTHISDGARARISPVDTYDIVLLDWMLPGFSGIDVLHYWRMQKIVTPVIMLTAKDGLNDTVMGLEFGADDYISKFFEWPELIARINALLRRTNSATTQIGPIILDRNNKQFSEKSSPVLLTKTEFKVLSYFFDHPSRLLTKDILIDALYSLDNSPDSNVIERHIKEIRKKIKYDIITTVHGMGYRLNT
jgi:DNA-binding response OmpR family regulator